MRFNYDATHTGEASWYFHHRARQFLADGLHWDGICFPVRDQGETWGLLTRFTDEEFNSYRSIYVLKQHRNKGHMSRALRRFRSEGHTMITSPPCQLYDILKSRCPTVLRAQHLALPEYKDIERFYAGKTAIRSGLHYMNHIDEGLALCGGPVTTKNDAALGFMAHPLVQNDEDLAANLSVLESTRCRRTIIMALEYGNIANRFLSPMTDHEGYQNPQKIDLSPIPAINQMLVADKVQNYKDFQRFRARYGNARRLDLYFQAWLQRLGVSAAEYDRMAKSIHVHEPTIADGFDL